MKTYNRRVPEKCEALPDFECENHDKTIKELGVFYESVLPDRDENLVCLCENCHLTYGLGRYYSDLSMGRKFELQRNGDWIFIELDSNPEKLEKTQKIVEEGFVAKIKKAARFIPFAETVVACYYCATDPKTPIYVKVSLFAALAYFVSPIDIIPDFLAFVGYLDDIAVLSAVIKIFDSNITDDHRLAAKHFMNDKIVENCSCQYCSEI